MEQNLHKYVLLKDLFLEAKYCFFCSQGHNDADLRHIMKFLDTQCVITCVYSLYCTLNHLWHGSGWAISSWSHYVWASGLQSNPNPCPSRATTFSGLGWNNSLADGKVTIREITPSKFTLSSAIRHTHSLPSEHALRLTQFTSLGSLTKTLVFSYKWGCIVFAC